MCPEKSLGLEKSWVPNWGVKVGLYLNNNAPWYSGSGIILVGFVIVIVIIGWESKVLKRCVLGKLSNLTWYTENQSEIPAKFPTQIFCTQKDFRPKFFFTQKMSDPIFFAPTKFPTQTFFDPKKFPTQIFCTQKNFRPKFFLTQKISDPNFFFTQKNFQTKFLFYFNF